ncbi:hypothetical protein SELMODRAFT_141946 [Selaginella moellendorffii]|uniref:Uncharacterized protein n=1 Tax=Selaginella moellendorffii TaxID=88036 RepID=D8QWX3_SELML|nr:outer envelope pore protein 16, chloroplastic [Selaginella moellendorffii]XP_002971570.1 outer envelope pore protein 16, chloroplastic isoform X2 [Selaginella moellendorffii]XP_024532293.1 outer envelope pore protein 16, chloroplastic isoform X2 [Selaginella moellendorffii]EFJ27319.1 hypothetical protein SELMODRAFT_95783 [Selaginella moellendorffii]EFJ35308.1 hypothetical protein SELMODRAFT_141946 [Selaginella moellendorffii]|eukprot:XP_002963437.1 outer envelope pore protein 16, chloroplastic [Selaginella moellendorffii]
MPKGRVSTSVNSPTVDIVIDMGNPFLNRTVDGFFKIGAVSAGHAAGQEAYKVLKKQTVTKHDLEYTLKRMGKDGLHWGAIAGLYTGMEYGIERVRGKHDWKNAMLGGAVTGALVSFGEHRYSRDKMVQNAIAGAAIATASEFLRHLT